MRFGDGTRGVPGLGICCVKFKTNICLQILLLSNDKQDKYCTLLDKIVTH